MISWGRHTYRFSAFTVFPAERRPGSRVMFEHHADLILRNFGRDAHHALLVTRAARSAGS
jgi:hypothetical protein